MSRQKNALTKYFIASRVEDVELAEWLRLAKWIPTVTDESEEEVESVAYYSGDGTEEDDIIAIKKSYSFEGMYDDTDEAHKFVRSLELETGNARKILLKQERTDGTTLVGKATISNIKTTGGEASEFEPLECTIAWDEKPTVVDVSVGG